ncbi:ammonium transporter [Fusibacter paucivorans]|uniref:Ammonium transporter n=1 Tax=Fusibacter paucivorans TaxID=76009 RepID=A0ABS5PV54_9FIRM|nr:ammonium transporter [Fusibacter paucivorans]MBS7528336.1 ammonium transporter [Fusibacter paucivorans]
MKNIGDYLWVIISAMIVFLMQPGFMALETGLTRAKNSINVAIKNMSDFILSIAAFWFFGFGLMFGKSFHGIFGATDFFVHFQADDWKAAFFIFQAVFVGTAATIDSGAVAERAKFSTYLLMSFITSSFIYPIFGHWAWGNFFYESNHGWLQSLGFLDFAGSTVVHSIGAWVALSGVIIIGPRCGRFTADGKANKIRGHNLVFAYFGVFILFFAWFGFNAGSTLTATTKIAIILTNTMISASFGGITGLFVSWKFSENHLPEPESIINGILGGLVGITAGCYYVNEFGALAIGVLSGFIVYFGTLLLEKVKLDDAVGAIPVHGFCGIWGTVATGIFIKNSFLIEFGVTRMHQIVVQFIGVAAAFFWSFGLSYVLMKIINHYVPMRVSLSHEEIGLNIAEHGASSSLLELSNSVRKIIENRNFKNADKIEVEYGTEIGELSNYFNSMVDDLREKEAAAEEALKSLHHMATTDGLTQILNRKSITETLDKEIARAQRYEHKLSILMFDIDFFKKVNDQFGHQIGDKVLIDISKNVSQTIRKSDYIGRYGGEEFLVIMPETELGNAYILASRIRENIERIKWDFGEDYCITISGGVVENYGEDINRMINRADSLLYYAKDSGRNKIAK